MPGIVRIRIRRILGFAGFADGVSTGFLLLVSAVGFEFGGWLEEAGPLHRCQRTAGGHATISPTFSCTQHAVVTRLRAGSDSPGDTSGAKPFPSQVFERRLPPGPVAILILTGLAVDALVLPLLMLGY